MGAHGEKRVVIIGAGPAGLTAAFELCKAGVEPVVLEKGDIVGGLAKTIKHNGFRFDIGGHRFYTKVKVVEDVWREVLDGRDFLRRKRLSRILYNKRFFHYPLRASSMILGLGFLDGCRILSSYIYARLFPEKKEENFEQWVTNRFGRRLYTVFFKTYTEKVWGIPCSEITAEWAAQRIKGLSLPAVLKDILLRQSNGQKGGVVKSLISEFDYPRLGPGMMWESMAELVKAKGGTIRTGARVERIFWTPRGVEAVEISDGERIETIHGTHFLSSMPARELVRKLSPSPPAEVLAAANKLQYRDFIIVALMINRRSVFPDNWIYIHDPEVKLGRIQNFKNWSPNMVPDQNKTCLGLEYFCFAGDGLWTSSDEELIALGKRELEILGLAGAGEVNEGKVVRVPKAYPVYDSAHQQALQTLRSFFGTLPNLQLVGRNGMHKYNNQDHSMLTAMLAVKNIMGANHDLWKVNTEQEYQEEINNCVDEISLTRLPDQSPGYLGSTQPAVPVRIQACAATPVTQLEG